jgi:FdrA protein
VSATPLVEVRRDTYLDSVLLMSASRILLEAVGVEWGAALMGNPANVDVLRQEGMPAGELAAARANDLVLAVRAASPEAAVAALEAAKARLLGEARPAASVMEVAARIRTIPEAVEKLAGANVAVVSVPGEFAALEAQRALSSGLHMLLFSDNVPVEREVELKQRGRELGLLVMGPGAGTAMLGNVGLGFANVVTAGPIGVVAAAGTGAQEVMSLIHGFGYGCSHVIGVGGRDLSAKVGGIMTRLALEALEADPRTETILLVSKPPAAAVAEAVLATPGRKPLVAALIGMESSIGAPSRVQLVGSLEAGAVRAVEISGGSPASPSTGLAASAAAAARGLAAERRAIRGLFSGGTLCFETMVLLSNRLGPVYSNTPLRPEWARPAPPGAHLCLDLGEEEFTRGRPHPMIDAEARIEHIRREAADPSVAVLLVDVVLGHGSHPDPAGALAPVLAEITANPEGPRVVAYVLGTDLDPQDASAQRRQLAEAGCVLAPTGARAALLAAAIAERQPQLAEQVV